MKRVAAMLLVLVVIIFNVTPGYCETPAFRKFRRGFCNLLTFYLEVGSQIERQGALGGNFRALTVGLINGLGMSAARAFAGAYEVATFPIPLPAEYKPILNDPEFYWTEPFSKGATK
jgi:putative exosortase-associated protein (TIGR04073 family)